LSIWLYRNLEIARKPLKQIQINLLSQYKTNSGWAGWLTPTRGQITNLPHKNTSGVALTSVNIRFSKNRRPEPFAGTVFATRLESTTQRRGNSAAVTADLAGECS